jgi:hypothetical protein
MKNTFFALMLVLLPTYVFSDGKKLATNSLFDQSETKSYSIKSVWVQGEVETPGPVDLTKLPLRNVAIKEIGAEEGKRVFKGAYYVSGYSLYDILNSKKFKKAPQNTFVPPVDLYALVENDLGEKVPFSWGEIYYRNGFDILITKSIQAINPTRSKATWPLPKVPRLVCATDLLNYRFIENPTKITVISFNQETPKEKPKEIYSPGFKIIPHMGTGEVTITEIRNSVGKRTYFDIGYGHGMGFKGAQEISGYLIKDIIADSANPKWNLESERSRVMRWIAVVSAKDGYRSVFSLSEIMNRADGRDVLLVDQKDSSGNGRYLIYPSGDFFADRDVKAVEKIELIETDINAARREVD